MDGRAIYDSGKTNKNILKLLQANLDWFHITIPITVLRQYLKGIAKENKENATTFENYLNKVKWYSYRLEYWF